MKPNFLAVEILEAKPNRMFSEDMRQLIRFLRYNQPVPCQACGKKARIHWAFLAEFDAIDFGRSQFVATSFGKAFAPLTPVCQDHPLQPPLKKDVTRCWLVDYKAGVTDSLRAFTQVLIFKPAIPCAACGRRRNMMWTSLLEFRTGIKGRDMLPTVHPPLTPICRKHTIHPVVAGYLLDTSGYPEDSHKPATGSKPKNPERPA